MVTAPPLDIEHTVLLKLVPRREEKLAWYREVISPDKNQYSATLYEQIKTIRDLQNQCEIAHYGDFAFRTDSVEVTRLKDMYDNTPQDVQKLLDWISIQQKAR